MDENKIREIKVHSLIYTESDFFSKSFPKKIEVYPDDNIWTFNKVAIFLNEMNVLYLAHNSFKKKIVDSLQCYTFNYKIPNFTPNERDYDCVVKIKDVITVKISTLYIARQWDSHTSKFFSFIGAQCSIRKLPIEQKHVSFSKNLPISPSSQIFYQNSEMPLFFFSKYNFSVALHHYFFGQKVEAGKSIFFFFYKI